jgi:hypothetical protein
MIEDRKHQKGATPDPESPTGTEATDARSASPGSSTIKGERRSTRANRGKLRSTENKMDQQFVSHQVKLDDEEPW